MRGLLAACLLLIFLRDALAEEEATAPVLNMPHQGLRGAGPALSENPEDVHAAKTRHVRLIVLKLDRTGSSLLGYSLNHLTEEILCAMANDTPLKDKPFWDDPGHIWVELELLNHRYGHEFTADDHLLRIKKKLGYEEACGEGDDIDCKPWRMCEGGGAFWGFTLSAVKDHNRERTEELFQKLMDYISSLPPDERPFVWVHKRRNVVLQSLSALKTRYFKKMRLCPESDPYHLDPKVCPEAMDPIPVTPERLAHFVTSREGQGDKTVFYASQLAAAAAGVAVVDEQGLWHWEAGDEQRWPCPLLDCTEPGSCRRVEGVWDGPVNAVSTSYEYLTQDKDNAGKALGLMLGGEGGRWRQLLEDLTPVKSPKSSPSNTRDKVVNFDELLDYAAQQSADSPWRGPLGYVAQLCQDAHPPCPSWLME